MSEREPRGQEEQPVEAEPIRQDEAVTLEAELRQAVQQRRAALERAREAQEDLEQALRRARDLLDRQRRR